MKILLSDDHHVVLEGLAGLLRAAFPSDAIETASSGAECRAAVKAFEPDILVLDIRLQDADGCELSRELKQNNPDLKIILFSGSNPQVRQANIQKSNCDGFFSKDTHPAIIVEAIQQLSLGEKIAEDDQNKLILPEGEISVSSRELEVLRLIAQGLINKAIGEKLFISASTVDTHRKNLLIKFGVNNVASLVAEAYKRGVLP